MIFSPKSFYNRILKRMPKFKKLGGTPNVMVIASLTIALFLIGLCGLLMLNAKKLTEIVKQNIEVQVHLDNDLPTEKLDLIFKQIAKYPFVLAKDQSPQINFVSKEVAAQQFMKESGEDIKKLLGSDNPLHNLYAVKIKDEYFVENRLKEIKTTLEQIDGVYEVAYVENFVDEVNRNIAKIYVVLSVFIFLLLIVIIMLVNNTIKLAMYSQRFLIRSMQLVGATDAFIRKPFLVKGAIQGLIGGFLACTFLIGLQQIAMQQIDGFRSLQEMDKLVMLLVIILIIGLLIGLTSTYRAVEKYLKMSLDDLY